MYKLAVAVAFSLLSLVNAAPHPSHRAHKCAHHMGGVHVLIARGTTEVGMGGMGTIAEAIVQQIPGSTIESIPYPAIWSPYQWSVDNGTHMMHDTIKRNIKACPKNKIVVLGYSQGAQVSMNALCGDHETAFGFQASKALKKHLRKHIAAVVVYGDPTYVAGQPYDDGTSTTNGVFPRADPSSCMPYADRLASYCDYGDPYCACGNDGAVHTAYFANYNTQAIQWVVAKTRKHTPYLHH